MATKIDEHALKVAINLGMLLKDYEKKKLIAVLSASMLSDMGRDELVSEIDLLYKSDLEERVGRAEFEEER